MRQISIYKEEIFRRSKVKLQQRQKRRRILSWCVPLVLCLAVYSTVSLIPAFSHKNSGSAPEAYLDGSSGSYVCSYETVTVRDLAKPEQNISSITDKVAVTKAYCTVFAFDESTYAGNSESNKHTALGGVDSDFRGYSDGYLITFRTAEGAESHCVLHGNELYFAAKDQSAQLTDGQVSQIEAALGISPDTGKETTG